MTNTVSIVRVMVGFEACGRRGLQCASSWPGEVAAIPLRQTERGEARLRDRARRRARTAARRRSRAAPAEKYSRSTRRRSPGRVVGGRAVERGEHRLHRRVAERGVGARAAPVGALEGGLELAQRGGRARLGRARDEHGAARRRALAARASTPLRTTASGSTTRVAGRLARDARGDLRGGERVLARVDHGAVAPGLRHHLHAGGRRRAPDLGRERRARPPRPPPRRRPGACRRRARAPAPARGRRRRGARTSGRRPGTSAAARPGRSGP